MSDDYRVFIYDEDEVIARAHKAMMEEAYKLDELRSKHPELSSLGDAASRLKLFDKKADLS